MLTRPLNIALAAAAAIAIGFALSFFELIALGIVAAVVAAVRAIRT
jgi:hypothetical protein